MAYYFLSEDLFFPPVGFASEDGILAIGGDLSLERLLLAYQNGIFPWYSQGEPIIWWSPDPRFVLFPESLKISHSIKPILKKGVFEVTYDQCFAEVVKNCQKIQRPGQKGTWITSEVLRAYKRLHEAGYAHSVEVWENKELVGGLYGVSLGSCFFGESMFAKVSNASKVGFVTLVQDLKEKGFELIDCQVYTEHLKSLGGEYMPRTAFVECLEKCLQKTSIIGNWQENLRKTTPLV